MTQIDLQNYMKNPCRVSSIPYWKTKTVSVPHGMLIIHDELYNDDYLNKYDDERYFRLQHNLINLYKPELPEGYSVICATSKQYADHINSCYYDLTVTEELIDSYTTHAVYDEDLWIAVVDKETNKIVASGIGEYDREIHEGVLEWIQVTETYRSNGLGGFVVNELLWRMKEKADFVTVSGKSDNKTNPERLYRSCGFTGNDLWHILKLKEV